MPVARTEGMARGKSYQGKQILFLMLDNLCHVCRVVINPWYKKSKRFCAPSEQVDWGYSQSKHFVDIKAYSSTRVRVGMGKNDIIPSI